MAPCLRPASLLACSLLLFGPPSPGRADDTAQTQPAQAATPAAPPDPSAGPPAEGHAKVPASKKAHRKRRRRRKPAAGFVFETQVRAGAGVMHGQRERRFDAVRFEVGAEFEPGWSVADFELSLPVDVTHRETVGVALRETRASGALEARYRLLPELRFGGTLGVRGVYRPDWPDLYQPVDSGFEPTDRHSYFSRLAELELTVHPGRHHWVRAGYEYKLSDYSQDPAFDALRRPNHLTPFDSEQHSAEVGYRFSTRTLKLGASVAGASKRYFFVFARDAHTGSTHAGPGGPPPNALRELERLTPELELQLEPSGSRVEVELRYAHEFQDDVFQGYYSFEGPHPSFEVRWSPWRRLELRAGMTLWWRRYGSGSYREGPGHPALDSGDRRYDRRLQSDVGAELRVARHFALTLDALHVVRDTNFPDYVPFEFPRSQRYAIDWDYTNLLVMLGLEWRRDWR